MDLSKLTTDQFPVIYEQGRPVAVLVDLQLFEQLVDTLVRFQDLAQDEEEAEWIMKVVQETRAYREAHPDEIMTFDTPEAVLAALDAPDD